MKTKEKNINVKEFNEFEKPRNMVWYLKVVAWFMKGYFNLTYGCKVNKGEIKGLKGPFLVLQNHASMTDFALTLKAIKPVNTTWVTSVEEFNGREWLFRQIGCFPKRKFTADVSVVKNIMYTFKKLKSACTIFPEARYSLAGINENINAPSYARLIKSLKVPVVVAISKGNFVSCPQWDKKSFKKIPVSCYFKKLLTAEEVESKSQDEIQKMLEESFVYDDFKYWQESGRKIKCKTRAKNSHFVLYKCPACKKEDMTSYDNTIECKCCGKKWTLDEHGYINAENGETEFTHFPDWYRWEREEVKKEVADGSYKFTDEVRIEKLVNPSIGFVNMGTGTLTHDENGFTISTKLDNGEDFNFNRTVESMYSCHIEYNYKGRGDAIDLATPDCKSTYFVFPLTKYNPLTKIHFATEELFKKFNGVE